VSNLTRRVSNKTFWIATSPQDFWLHFPKVMARETLALFKSFEEIADESRTEFVPFRILCGLFFPNWFLTVHTERLARWVRSVNSL
jgi:hypothetical protein